ncbi:hypothetical protein [Desulfofundulus thermocisternus]|uniref:hypothetical protein n=1 Tax=Desulfofundulus thermocisternus TaxID=42471 RepID=UPI00217D5AC2|nr:hypothetical protein [Desulfofundulus thermocisternus]MCS5696957.1 hypothetical protein [Desulfofundulus thermocisternus]
MSNNKGNSGGYRQFNIFDYPILNLDQQELEKELKRLQSIYKEAGNPPGGVAISDLPEELQRKVYALCNAGYARLWDERIILKTEFQVPNTVEDVLPLFMEKAKGLNFNQLLALRTEFEIHYHDPGISRAIWEASVEICRKYITVEQYLNDYKEFRCRVDKNVLKAIVPLLINMSFEEEIRDFLQNQQDGDGWYFFPSDYCCVFISKCKDPGEMVGLLERCGRTNKPPILKYQGNPVDKSV